VIKVGKYEVHYNGKVIEFELYRKNVKNVNVNVKPDMTVMISANEKVPVEFIMNFVKSRAPWILKNIKWALIFSFLLCKRVKLYNIKLYATFIMNFYLKYVNMYLANEECNKHHS